MAKKNTAEKWKTIEFDSEYTNELRIEISNMGRVRTFHKTSNGNIINGSMVNGYRIIRLKLFRPRLPKTTATVERLQKQIARLKKQIAVAEEKKGTKKEVKELMAQLNTHKQSLQMAFATDAKQRTIHFHGLIHRLVANAFLRKPAAGKTIVAHLDFDKLNNQADNLKWMTPEENYEHQKKSPYVIAEKKLRKDRDNNSTNVAKLSIDKVKQLKKMLNQNMPIRQLAKQFEVTDTQILRIKRGENWGKVPAAK